MIIFKSMTDLNQLNPSDPALDDYFYAVYLTNNEFALEFLIPDAEWLDADLRERLEEYLI